MEIKDLLDNYIIPSQLFTAMLGMGLTLRIEDFKKVFLAPKGLWAALGLQLVFVPVASLLWGRVFGLSWEWQLGLIVVAATPGGAWSNLFTFFAKANVPLSIAATIVTTTLAMVSTPIIVSILASDLVPSKISLDIVTNMVKLGAFAIFPLVVGVAVCERSERGSADKWSKRFIRLTSAFLIAVVVLSLGSGRIKIGSYGLMPIVYIISFMIALALVTPHLLRLMKFHDEDNIALSIEVVMRNINIGLFLIPTLALSDAASGILAFVCLAYGGASAMCCLPFLLVGRFRKGSMVLGRRAWFRED